MPIEATCRKRQVASDPVWSTRSSHHYSALLDRIEVRINEAAREATCSSMDYDHERSERVDEH